MSNFVFECSCGHQNSFYILHDIINEYSCEKCHQKIGYVGNNVIKLYDNHRVRSCRIKSLWEDLVRYTTVPYDVRTATIWSGTFTLLDSTASE